jgi:hypothetical protein
VRRRLALAFVVLLAAGCLAGGPHPASAPTATAGQAAGADAVRFVAIGDMGTGDADQARVAKAMQAVCAQRGCQFAVGLGDLIYPAGASSATDPQFDSKFEVPYKDLDFPFWMVLGNHDNSQDPAGTSMTGGLGAWYDAGNNEVAYAQRTDRTSTRWHEPARHYTFSAGPVYFVALDTNTMLFYGVPVPPDLGAAVQDQEAWLPGAVASGKGSWKVAFGHHPYLSNGAHGDAGDFDGRPIPGQDGDHLKALFEADLCDKVDLYLSGHDHDLEWLQPVPSCGRTQFIVSGGGGAGLYDLVDRDAQAFQKASLGFWWIELTGDTLHAAAYDDSADLLYEAAVPKPLPATPPA